MLIKYFRGIFAPILFFFLVKSNFAFSGPSKDHMHFNKGVTNNRSISKTKAIELAQGHVFRLTMKGKLNRSWLRSKFLDIKKKMFYGKNEWVLRFKNEKEIEKVDILYIFLKMDGSYLAANFSGK